MAEIPVISYDELFTSKGNECYLGEGSFGLVYRCYHSTIGDVAVKILNSATSKPVQSFNREGLMHLRANRCEHILTLHGIAQKDNFVGLVLEYMPYGSLSDIVLDETVELPWRFRLRALSEIASGIHYLHHLPSGRRLVHCDLKLENILMNGDLHAKIGDFGGANLSTYTGHTMTTTSRGARGVECDEKKLQYTLSYTAPEVLSCIDIDRTPAMDVYSMGIVMYVITVRKNAFDGLQKEVIIHAVTNGQRPQKYVDDVKEDLVGDTDEVGLQIFRLLDHLRPQCWHQEPLRRMKIENIRNSLVNKFNSFSLDSVERDLSTVKRQLKRSNPLPSERVPIIHKHKELLHGGKLQDRTKDRRNPRAFVQDNRSGPDKLLLHLSSSSLYQPQSEASPPVHPDPSLTNPRNVERSQEPNISQGCAHESNSEALVPPLHPCVSTTVSKLRSISEMITTHRLFQELRSFSTLCTSGVLGLMRSLRLLGTGARTRVLQPVVYYNKNNFAVALLLNMDTVKRKCFEHIKVQFGTADIRVREFNVFSCQETDIVCSSLICSNPTKGFDFSPLERYPHQVSDIFKYKTNSIAFSVLNSEKESQVVTMILQLSSNEFKDSHAFQYSWRLNESPRRREPTLYQDGGMVAGIVNFGGKIEVDRKHCTEIYHGTTTAGCVHQPQAEAPPTQCCPWESSSPTAPNISEMRTTQASRHHSTTDSSPTKPITIERSQGPPATTLPTKLSQQQCLIELEESFRDPYFRQGNTVTMITDLAVIKNAQVGHGGWNDKLLSVRDAEGIVRSVEANGDVMVTFSGFESHRFNPISLTKLPCPNELSVGDFVKITLEKDIVSAMQDGHGGWKNDMHAFINETGLVYRFLPKGDVLVLYKTGIYFSYNPEVLVKVKKKTDYVRLNDNPAIEIGDYVYYDMDRDLLKELQEHCGEWNDAMADLRGKVGKFVYADYHGRAFIAYSSKQCYIFNAAVLNKISPEKACSGPSSRIRR